MNTNSDDYGKIKQKRQLWGVNYAVTIFWIQAIFDRASTSIGIRAGEQGGSGRECPIQTKISEEFFVSPLISCPRLPLSLLNTQSLR
jgi:hypothetical protein